MSNRKSCKYTHNSYEILRFLLINNKIDKLREKGVQGRRASVGVR